MKNVLLFFLTVWLIAIPSCMAPNDYIPAMRTSGGNNHVVTFTLSYITIGLSIVVAGLVIWIMAWIIRMQQYVIGDFADIIEGYARKYESPVYYEFHNAKEDIDQFISDRLACKDAPV